ncbi:MAG TPA: hypothetical protein VIY47_08085 [Ignavibacteriaceae bacterium]
MSPGVLFYQSIAFSFLFSFLLWLFLFITNSNNKIKDPFIVLLLCYSFYLTVPVTVERSYSVYMITKIEKETKPVSQSKIEGYFYDFVKEKNIEKRINEQLVSNNIEKDNNKYILSKQGILINEIFNFIRKTFKL